MVLKEIAEGIKKLLFSMPETPHDAQEVMHEHRRQTKLLLREVDPQKTLDMLFQDPKLPGGYKLALERGGVTYNHLVAIHESGNDITDYIIGALANPEYLRNYAKMVRYLDTDADPLQKIGEYLKLDVEDYKSRRDVARQAVELINNYHDNCSDENLQRFRDFYQENKVFAFKALGVVVRDPRILTEYGAEKSHKVLEKLAEAVGGVISGKQLMILDST